MATDRFLIGSLDSGLVADKKARLIPDNAFAKLVNAYVFRSRVRKRFGARLLNGSVATGQQQLYSRLRIKVGNTGVSMTGTAPGAIFKPGQMFSIGTVMFTVYQLGTPAAMYSTSGTLTGTFDTTTGVYTFAGAVPATDIYFYPAQPVMGLIIYERPNVNDEFTFGFDTQFAYQYLGGGWERLGTASWQGTDSQFFWSTNVRNIAADLSVTPLLFVTNNNYADLMKYWDGSVWHLFTPNTADGTGNYFIGTARIILQFHGRLVLLNTQEWVNGSVQNYLNRCRYSQVGNVLDPEAFRTDIKGKGGLIGAPTAEAITSAKFLKDRLIVSFERSTWELVYTSNQVLPFVWQKLDATLGVESTFSTVSFDKVIYGMGNVGIHACNGVNVERIDTKIPETVFEINNDDQGPERVYGIRDYYTEMIYWAYPSHDSNVYPSSILAYNYRNDTWSFNEDSITCFGYYQKDDALRWGTTNLAWGESESTWGGASNDPKVLDIIAGNQQGFTFIIDSNIARNSASLQITKWLANSTTITVYNHNLNERDVIYISGLFYNGTPFPDFFSKVHVVDKDTITVNAVYDLTHDYNGGLTIERVSLIDILTKEYNFYESQGRNAQINKVNFLIDKAIGPNYAVDFYVGTSVQAISSSSTQAGALVSTSVLETTPYTLYPLEATQDRLWHPVYLNADGATIQLHIYMDPDVAVAAGTSVFTDFELHAMLFYAKASSMNIF